MNLPNKLTLFRIILAPVFLIIFMMNKIPGHYAISLGIYAIACITDFFDGKIARKYNMISNFGKLADPIADKMLTTAALLGLMSIGYCNIYTIFVILTREFTVTGLRLAAAAQGVVIPANIWGKIKTALQMIFTVFVIFILTMQSFDMLLTFPLRFFSEISLGFTALLAVISGVIYIIDGARVVDFNK